jgi:adenine deaminase
MKNINNLIAVATGKKKADIVLKNAQVLNVFTRKFIPQDIAILEEYIAGVGKSGSYSGETEIDCSGSYITPGFIDAHVHIESSMVLPLAFSEAVVRHGTTAVIADSHEIANVLGPDAVRFMCRQSEKALCDIYFMIPSCVPATDFEHTGGCITSQDINTLLQLPKVLGLGEMMNYPGLLGCDPEVLQKIKATQNFEGKRTVLDGHAPLVSGLDLQGYKVCGIQTDHECHTFEEALEKVENGMYVLIRLGSSAKDLYTIVPNLVASGIDTNRFLFCTDDKNIADILDYGHIDSNIRSAIELGISPEKAFTMASWQTASCYHLEEQGAVCAGYRADLVFLSDIQKVCINKVMKNGEFIPMEYVSQKPEMDEEDLNTESGDLLFRACHSVKLPEIQPDFFTFGKKDSLLASGEEVEKYQGRYVIQIHENTLNTESLFIPKEKISKKLKTGELCRLAVLERHGGGGAHSLALLSGYGLKQGAIASSIGHDSHNIICAGQSPEDMVLAVETIKKMAGGICIVHNGVVKAQLPLPVAGLMSDESGTSVKDKLEELQKEVGILGIYEHIEPFVTLSFLALPVIPTLRLTDKGLFDVIKWSFL